jgi:hypothetical protein
MELGYLPDPRLDPPPQRVRVTDNREIPLIRRLLGAFLALRSHPPTVLRLWWARLTPPGSA